MSNVNRDYAIVYDVKNSTLVLRSPLVFYLTDKNTSNIFVRLVTKTNIGNGIDQYTDIEDASSYIVMMRVIKPNDEVANIKATQREPESIFEFDLTENLKDIPGTYICELMISTMVDSRQELITSDSFTYEVKRSVLSKIDQIIEHEATTVEKLLNELDATKAELYSRVDEVENKIKNVCMLMPPSSTVDKNTSNLQSILNLAKNKDVNLIVQFPAGYYELKPCTIFDNTTIKLTNNTTLKSVSAPYYNKNFNVNEDIDILFFNAIPHDDNELNITGYNGRSNITIEGGIFEAKSAICFIHGENITFRNTKFKNCDYDHYMQIGSCKNVKIENCEFCGVTQRASNRQYVEFIQIDWATYESMPYWLSSGAIYDNNVNDGIEIINCKFTKGSDSYVYLPVAIGSHAGQDGINNKNIIIKGCEFNGFDFAGITLKYMDNVVIEDNKFISTNNKDSYGITIDSCKNVNVGKGNYFTGDARTISIYNACSNININNFTIENSNRVSDIILIGESNNIIVDGIIFNKCYSDGEIIKVRNCNYVSINNCKVFDTTVGKTFFANIYTNNGRTSSYVDVSNNIVSFAEAYFNPNVTNVKRTKDQILWSGAINSGSLTLNDTLEKYQHLRVTYDLYGTGTIPLNFVDDKCILRIFNIPDSGDTLSVSLFEVHLLLNNKIITIEKIRELNISNGNMSYVENSNSFYLKEIRGSKFRV